MLTLLIPLLSLTKPSLRILDTMTAYLLTLLNRMKVDNTDSSQTLRLHRGSISDSATRNSTTFPFTDTFTLSLLPRRRYEDPFSLQTPFLSVTCSFSLVCSVAGTRSLALLDKNGMEFSCRH